MRSPTPPTASSAPAKSSLPRTDLAQPSQTLKNVRLPANRYVLFLFLAVGGTLLDLFTKSWVFNQYFEPTLMYTGQAQVPHWWIDGILGIQCSTNPGALFGIGKGYSFVFAMISLVALVGILLWLFVFKQAMDRLVNFSLGLITGGILGNLYDRLGYGYQVGYPEDIKDNVRDWILFRWEGGPSIFDPWPNFNIADALLVTGAILLFLHAVIYGDPKPQNEQADVEPASAA